MNVAEHMRSGRWRLAAVAGVCVLALAGCSLGGGDTAKTSNTALAINAVPWCDGQSLLSFQDDSTTAQTTLTDWSQVKGQLGFTPYLPTTLPKGTCLALAGGTIHDPIYGGHLSVTYVVPNVGPVSFSEAPIHSGQQRAIQCVANSQQPSSTSTSTSTSTSAATAICIGVQGSTTITLASTQSTTQLQDFFKTLAPAKDWAPAATPTPQPTATTPGSSSSTPSATATTGK